MKTVDLIPLILLELNIEDKYGLDLTKSIETKSHGKIVIKQPTLYTILKKLEKSRFITSYWQDSDIGGKRHYYKITSNGRMQVSTLPSFETLVNNILASENTADSTPQSTTSVKVESITSIKQTTVESRPKETKPNDNYSIFDFLGSEPEPQKESILPSEEVFAEETIDTTTEFEVNKSNSNLLKDEKTKVDEVFASNENVAKFAEHSNSTLSKEYKDQLKAIYESKDNRQDKKPIINPAVNFNEIKYVDYNDFKTDKKHIQAKQTCQNILYKVLSTCAYLFVVLVLNCIITNFTGKSALYYFFSITSLFALIFYPTVYAFVYEKLRLKFVKQPHKIDLKKRSIILICVEVIIILTTLIINICIGNNTLNSLFGISNYASLYAILLMSLTIFADLLFTYLFLIKKHKK